MINSTQVGFAVIKHTNILMSSLLASQTHNYEFREGLCKYHSLKQQLEKKPSRATFFKSHVNFIAQTIDTYPIEGILLLGATP